MLLSSVHHSSAQTSVIDSLKRELNNISYQSQKVNGFTKDTLRITLLTSLSFKMRVRNIDSSYQLLAEATNICETALNATNLTAYQRMDLKIRRENIRYTLGHTHYFENDFEKAKEVGNEVLSNLKGMEEIEFQDLRKKVYDIQTSTYIYIAVTHHRKAEYTEAITYYKLAQDKANLAENERKVSLLYNNMGVLYKNLGEYKTAMDCYYKSLEIDLRNDDEKSIAETYGNIGVLYKNMDDYEKAMEYYEKAVTINKKLNAQRSLSQNYNNMGVLLKIEGKYDEALKIYDEALELSKKTKDVKSELSTSINIAIVYKNMKEYTSAIEQFLKANDLAQSLSSKREEATISLNLGEIYYLQGNKTQAKAAFDKALQIGFQIDSDQLKQSANFNLHEFYLTSGDYKKALSHYKEYISLRDSTNNLENKKLAIQKEMGFEYAMKHKADSIRQAIESNKEIEIREIELAKQNAELDYKNKQQIFLYTGIALLIVFAFFIYNRLKITKEQNKVIAEQKEIVEHKSIEIKDSIQYAKRIQDAMLPTHTKLKDRLKDGFVYYLPKDVVSGDFYWVEQKNNDIYIAVGDCTGHGVPGAMVSLVCSNALSKALLEENIFSTGDLLDRTKAIVVEHLSKSDEQINDGMDVCLVRIKNYVSNMNLSSHEIEYSGANSPLWIVKKSNTAFLPNDDLKEKSTKLKESLIEETTFIEIKADKQPIGSFIHNKSFETISLTVEQGDKLFLFSDGYSDQFGGDKGKKFKSTNFKRLIAKNSTLDSLSFEKEIKNTLATWKGNEEQNDDICVVSIYI